jgi:putative peptidoglycan lipid II flippase
MFSTQKAVKTVSFMIFATLSAKILGMFRDIFLADFYGTKTAAVAFLTASRIPLLFFDIGLGAAITSTFIPIFNEYLEKKNKKQAIEFSNNFINIVIISTATLTLLGLIFADGLVNIIAGGLNAETHNLAVELVRILFPMIIFAGLAFSFVGILHSFNEFNIPAAISLVSNGIIIVYFILLNEKYGIYGLAITMVFAWASQMLVQIPALIKKGYKYSPRMSFKSEGIKKVSIAVIPILISSWIQPINTMVNLHLASYLNKGAAVAALDYANKLYIIVVGVFAYALSNLTFPSLSRFVAGGDKESFSKLLEKTLKIILLVISPVMIGFIVCRIPIIKLIYERGAFGETATELTSIALLFYSLGMLGFAFHELLSKAFFALQNSKIPMKMAAFTMIINVVLSLVLIRIFGFGLGALAFAASISAIFYGLVLLIKINKKMNILFSKDGLIYIIKIFVASLIMGILITILREKIILLISMDTLIHKMLVVMILGILGALIYLVLILFLKISEVYELLSLIKDKINWRGKSE